MGSYYVDAIGRHADAACALDPVVGSGMLCIDSRPCRGDADSIRGGVLGLKEAIYLSPLVRQRGVVAPYLSGCLWNE